MSTPLLVGTYGEKLGHVDGKGKGVYAVRFDRETLSLVPFTPTAGLTTPQLGGASGLVNPTWLTSCGDGKVLYICDERGDGPGNLAAVSVDAATGALALLNSIPADDRAGGAACCHASVTVRSVASVTTRDVGADGGRG